MCYAFKHTPTTMLLLLLCIAGSFIVLPGCDKEEEKTPQQPFQITAGEIDPDGLYHDFQPDMALQPAHIACFGMRDELTIDLNADGYSDIFLSFENADGYEQCDCFYQENPPSDSLLSDCFPVSYISKRMKAVNENFQIAAEDSAHHQIVAALEPGAVIDETLQWRSGNFLELHHTAQMGGSPYGHWRNGTHFAGIRLIEANDTLYGWIRINTDSVITVIDYALEQ